MAFNSYSTDIRRSRLICSSPCQNASHLEVMSIEYTGQIFKPVIWSRKHLSIDNAGSLKISDYLFFACFSS